MFDRSIALARCRWEILRRTARYRADVRILFEQTARGVGWRMSRFQEHCLAEGGVVDRVADGVLDKHYDDLCARYGLTVVMHPDVSLSDDEMAAFPVFADTPARQLQVRDRALLRRVARRGGDVSARTARRMFGKAVVTPGPFQAAMRRLHADRLDPMFAVFDARTAGETFDAIAQRLNLNTDQAKRAWQRACVLIDHWFDIEPHLVQCPDCLACVTGSRDRYCKALELQIGRQGSRGVRTRTMASCHLDLIDARQKGRLPARRSVRITDVRSG